MVRPIIQLGILGALAATAAAKPIAYTTTGHGEAAGVALRDHLKARGYEVRATNLAKGVPADAMLLVVLDPHAEIPEVQQAAVAGYLGKGGRAILVFDPADAPLPRTLGMAVPMDPLQCLMTIDAAPYLDGPHGFRDPHSAKLIDVVASRATSPR